MENIERMALVAIAALGVIVGVIFYRDSRTERVARIKTELENTLLKERLEFYEHPVIETE